MGVVGANGAEADGSSCGVPDTDGKVEGKKGEECLAEKVGGGQSASGRGEKTAPDLLGKEAGKIGVMDGLTEYLRGTQEGDMVRERGGATGVMVETGSSRETSEGPVKNYFGGGKGVVATGIWKGWRGKGSGGEEC